ncbi:Uncharacterised protein [Clostridioides difficile]|nr:Uncharacterised protein [Clostridioides difficile]
MKPFQIDFIILVPPSNICLTPSIIFLLSPVTMPIIKSNIPFKIDARPFNTLVIVSTTALNAVARVDKTTTNFAI